MAGIDLNPSEVELVWSKCDHNADGEISYEEFVDALARDTVAVAALNKRGMNAREAMGVDSSGGDSGGKVRNHKFVPLLERTTRHDLNQDY